MPAGNARHARRGPTDRSTLRNPKAYTLARKPRPCPRAQCRYFPSAPGYLCLPVLHLHPTCASVTRTLVLLLTSHSGMLGCSLWSLARSLVFGSWHLGICAPGLALDTPPQRETSNPNLGASPTRLTGRISCCEMTTSTARATPRRQDPTAGKPLPASVGNSKFKADTRGSDPRNGILSTETHHRTQGLTRSHSSELLSRRRATGEPQREPRFKGTPGPPRHLALPFIHTCSCQR